MKQPSFERGSRTFIAKREKSMLGFKESKEELTLLLGVNVTDDFKLEPVLICHSRNPGSLIINQNILYLCSRNGILKPE